MGMRKGNRLGVIALVLAIIGMLALAPANAQGWYFINEQPASPQIARQMANRNLPYGHYWLNNYGNWGMVGNSYPMGNIYGRHRSLSERGMLFSPGELMR